MAAASSLPGMAEAAPPAVIAGAIRWDSWYSNQGDALQGQNSLSPAQWNFRAPWFSTANPNILRSNGSQTNMDLEIQCAANAGLKYWAFDQFDPNGSDSMFLNAWNFYQASSKNNLINWCWMGFGDPSYFGSTGNFSTQVAQFVTWFQQSNYQKVLTNRPLLYLDFTAAPASFGGSVSNFNAMLSALASACTTAGLGVPYLVVCGGMPLNHNFAVQISADAISAYAAVVVNPAQPSPYSTLVSTAEGFWTQMASSGSNIVPCCIVGWDTRPRKQNPPTYSLPTYVPAYSGLLNYFTPGSTSAIAAHVQDAVNYIGANPTIVPSAAILIYSWTECDEGGGCLIPTIGDPPQVGNTTNVLTAIGAVLN